MQPWTVWPLTKIKLILGGARRNSRALVDLEGVAEVRGGTVCQSLRSAISGASPALAAGSDPPRLEPNAVVEDLNTFPRGKPLGMCMCVGGLYKRERAEPWGEMAPCGQNQAVVWAVIQPQWSPSTGRGEESETLGPRGWGWRQGVLSVTKTFVTLSNQLLCGASKLPEGKLIVGGQLLRALWKLA